jgi:hypothetical protein
MILRNGKFSGKILRKIFRTGKFSMENFPPHITSCSAIGKTINILLLPPTIYYSVQRFCSWNSGIKEALGALAFIRALN